MVRFIVVFIFFAHRPVVLYLNRDLAIGIYIQCMFVLFL